MNSTGVEGDSADSRKPLIFPGRISHRRFRPKRHGFSYSYLMVRIPVGWSGCVNKFLSIDTKPGQSRGWLHVDAADHLSREPSTADLRSKLDSYLQSQHVDPTQYPHAVLVCQPSIFGYQFNPASFWHLYNVRMEHTAMVVEVNNTFGERRMYLLRPSHKSADAPDGLQQRLHSSWTKDFHVSPFNSRLGSYSIASLDPVFQGHGGSDRLVGPRLDNTITLSTSDGMPKLVARAWSTEKPLDPAAMSCLDKARLIAGWGWVGLVTFPRIVREAAKLFFRHRLHVWYRPEVLPTATGRTPTAEEVVIEKYFRSYLRRAVACAPTVLAVRYEPPESLTSKSELFASTSCGDKIPDPLKLNVTTPAFYSRIVHYADMSVGLSEEVLGNEDRNRTGWCSDETGLMKFTRGDPDLRHRVDTRDNGDSGTSIIVQMLMCLASHLRLPPAAMSYPWPAISNPSKEQEEEHKKVLPRGAPSGWPRLDDLILQTSPPAEAQEILFAEVTIFAAERFAFGSTALLKAEAAIALMILLCFGPLISLVSAGWMAAAWRVSR